MKQYWLFFLLFLLLLLPIFSAREPAAELSVPESISSAIPTEETLPLTFPTEPETIPTMPEPQLFLTEEEKNMLLKLGMAERGNSECRECIALVMRTVLNRVDSKRFGKNIRSVISAPGQFTPVMNGSYHSAKPTQLCYEALDMVICGWDESQGALYYEWCENESWHSENLNLLFQHCDVRFYDEKRK